MFALDHRGQMKSHSIMNVTWERVPAAVVRVKLSHQKCGRRHQYDRTKGKKRQMEFCGRKCQISQDCPSGPGKAVAYAFLLE